LTVFKQGSAILPKHILIKDNNTPDPKPGDKMPENLFDSLKSRHSGASF
jgi:hypothetical protein